MDESAQQAVQLGVNITIFIVALSISLTLLIGVRDVAEKAFDYDASIPTGSRVVSVENQKKRIVSGDEILTYYANYITDVNNLGTDKYEITIENLTGNTIIKETEINAIRQDTNSRTLKKFLKDKGLDFTKSYEVIINGYTEDGQITKVTLRESELSEYDYGGIDYAGGQAGTGGTQNGGSLVGGSGFAGSEGGGSDLGEVEIGGTGVSGEQSEESEEENVETELAVKIPEGFTISIYPGETKVEEGLVIYETDAETLSRYTQEEAQETFNQFVWVPVPNINEFARVNWFAPFDWRWDGYAEPAPDYANYEGEVAEYEDMYDSVANNGGFYMGRYETGVLDDETVVIMKGKNPKVNIPWNAQWTNSNSNRKITNGAVYLSKNNVIGNTTDVVSTLCYSVQWDAALKFISNSYDVLNSKTWGNYSTSCEEWEPDICYGTLRNTGYSDNWKAKNIYDMAGNVEEWTMEYFGIGNIRMTRGGNYRSAEGASAASWRGGATYTITSYLIGFRVALYLK